MMDPLLLLLAILLARQGSSSSSSSQPSQTQPGAIYPYPIPYQRPDGTWVGPWTAYYPQPQYPGPVYPYPAPYQRPDGTWVGPWTAYYPPPVTPGGLVPSQTTPPPPVPPQPTPPTTGPCMPPWPTPQGGLPVTQGPPRPWRRIREGDTGYGLAKKATGVGGRWRELLDANPDLTTYTDAKGATQLRPWEVGQKIYLPADWAKVADGIDPGMPVPMPGGPMIQASGQVAARL